MIKKLLIEHSHHSSDLSKEKYNYDNLNHK